MKSPAASSSIGCFGSSHTSNKGSFNCLGQIAERPAVFSFPLLSPSREYRRFFADKENRRAKALFHVSPSVSHEFFFWILFRAGKTTKFIWAVDFFSIEKVFFQHQELFQHPKGVFSAPGVFSASTVFYQHLRCFSNTRKRLFLQHQKGVF